MNKQHANKSPNSNKNAAPDTLSTATAIIPTISTIKTNIVNNIIDYTSSYFLIIPPVYFANVAFLSLSTEI